MVVTNCMRIIKLRFMINIMIIWSNSRLLYICYLILKSNLMKKTVLLIFAAFVGVSAFGQGQIGNGDMESWANNDEPDNWNSFLTGSGTWSSFAGDQCDPANDARPGSSGTTSCRIWANSVLTTLANGNVTLGRIEMGSTSPTSPDNYNYSITANPDFSEALTDQPDSIVYWVKFNTGSPNDNGKMKATLHTDYDYQDPEDAASSNEVVATAIDIFPSTNGSWERHSIAFDYSGPASVNAFILVTFTTNEVGGQGSNGDELFIDDVELIYNSGGANIVEPSNDGVEVAMNNYSNTITVVSENELNGTYEIYNTLGQVVLSGQLTNEISFVEPSGIYFVHLTTDTKIYNFEIFKN